MRTVILLLILFSLPIFIMGELIDFVPADYDFFLLFKEGSLYYPMIKSIPFFNFLLGEEGLGLEYVAKSLLENVSYNTRVSQDLLYEVLGRDVLFAARGMIFEIQSLFSLDLNYYVEALRNIGTNSILVFETDKPEQFIKFIAGITNLKLSYNEQTWILQDTDVAIFSRYHRGYLVFSGSKIALEKAIDTYDRPESQMRNHPAVQRLLNQPTWICGFFKGNSFGIDFPGINSNSYDTDYFTVLGLPNGESLQIIVRQYLNESDDLDKYLSNSSNMRNMPLIGDLAFSATASGPSDIAHEISLWFQGVEEEIKKIYDVVSYILNLSEGRVYLTSDLSGEQIRFAAIFDLAEKFDNSILVKYGARNFGEEYRLPILNGFVSFFEQGRNLIMTNMSKDEYDRISSRKRLRDDAAYQYLSKELPEKDIMRIYVDLGKIVESLLGMKARGRVMICEYLENGILIYKVEVM
ncbi:hypothetical protein [Pseudothermotoga sp.]|uniref:hypothetical protein n=1 Tax=Pseudothermotoga sp. TaxID=2033661 RepID=UPI000E919FF6|nr:hypothetical protein [Pseudothermotoga sp.]HBJ80412.1 hypothetical protein [Pseudothermotoga sp.]